MSPTHVCVLQSSNSSTSSSTATLARLVCLAKVSLVTAVISMCFYSTLPKTTTTYKKHDPVKQSCFLCKPSISTTEGARTKYSHKNKCTKTNTYVKVALSSHGTSSVQHWHHHNNNRCNLLPVAYSLLRSTSGLLHEVRIGTKLRREALLRRPSSRAPRGLLALQST